MSGLAQSEFSSWYGSKIDGLKCSLWVVVDWPLDLGRGHARKGVRSGTRKQNFACSHTPARVTD
jgi:hypothetical protein